MFPFVAGLCGCSARQSSKGDSRGAAEPPSKHHAGPGAGHQEQQEEGQSQWARCSAVSSRGQVAEAEPRGAGATEGPHMAEASQPRQKGAHTLFLLLCTLACLDESISGSVMLSRAVLCMPHAMGVANIADEGRL